MERFTAITQKARENFGEWFIPTIAVVILALIFFIAGGGVSQNDRWRINSITIAGANTVSPDEIRALVKKKLLGNYFFVYARENSYLYPQQEIEQALLEVFPRLIGVHIVRLDAHTIAVTVSERKPYALWCGDEYHAGQELSDCWFVDAMGFIFDRAPVFSPGVYVEIYGILDEKNAGEKLCGQLPIIQFLAIGTFAQMVRSEIGEPARIVFGDDGVIELTIRSSSSHPFLSGVILRFNDGYIPEVLMKNLRAAIPVQFPGNVAHKKKLLYIDMRFGNKLFFGFEN